MGLRKCRSWIVGASALGGAIGLGACGSSSPASSSSTTTTTSAPTTSSTSGATGSTGRSSTSGATAATGGSGTGPTAGTGATPTGSTGVGTGSTGTPTGGTGPTSAGDNLLWHVTVTYSGAESGSESFAAGMLLQNEETAEYFDCAYAASHTNSSQYVEAGSQPQFIVPDDPGADFEPVGTPKRTIDVLFNIDTYTGPGSYSSANSNRAVDIELGAKALSSGDFTYSVLPPAGSWKMVVDPDASGSFTFSDAKPATQFGSTATGTLSGSVTWTCENINPHP